MKGFTYKNNTYFSVVVLVHVEGNLSFTNIYVTIKAQITVDSKIFHQILRFTNLC